MNSNIKIKALDIDENDFTKFRIFFDNGLISSPFEFYHYIDCFTEFALKLESFPIDVNDTITFEVGEDSEKWAYYLALKISCESDGRSIIHIKLDNHLGDSDLIKAEFFIKTLPASLNKFGQLLKSWNPKESTEVSWETTY
ncbi:hypothetical protein [Flavobacterium sp. AED]|uniref:hypothetical protein n=1 Tax=Flavobacterium sp. AED TaxID=1423323 RepID=UPI00057E4214|nr:hypothetical protein [Flavobacterium sp. AED]KIA87031.1 hypothetical protein OA85_05260 [Flavobacterium sp. AED]